MLEKDNKKAREDARREYNETVRVSNRNSIFWYTKEQIVLSPQALTTFIRKRDPRYKSHLVRQAQVGASASKNKSTPRASGNTTPQRAAAGAYVEQAWQKSTRSKFDEDADLEWAAAEADRDTEEWECVACGKTFRSEAAWDSHERSKKHMQAVEKLKRQMLEEDGDLGLEDDVGEVSDAEQEEHDTQVPIDPDMKVDALLPSPDTALQPPPDASVEDPPNQQRSRSKKKKAKPRSRVPSPSPLSKSERRAKNRQEIAGVDILPSNDGGVSPSPSDPKDAMSEGPIPPSAGFDDCDTQPPQNEMSKRDKRRARDAAKKAQVDLATNQLVCQSYLSS